MTRTTLPRQPKRAATVRERDRKPRRWFGVAFGLLLGLAAVCHGCHLGDHDDELSVHGRAPQTQRGRDDPGKSPAGSGRGITDER